MNNLWLALSLVPIPIVCAAPNPSTTYSQVGSVKSTVTESANHILASTTSNPYSTTKIIIIVVAIVVVIVIIVVIRFVIRRRRETGKTPSWLPFNIPNYEDSTRLAEQQDLQERQARELAELRATVEAGEVAKMQNALYQTQGHGVGGGGGNYQLPPGTQWQGANPQVPATPAYPNQVYFQHQEIPPNSLMPSPLPGSVPQPQPPTPPPISSPPIPQGEAELLQARIAQMEVEANPSLRQEKAFHLPSGPIPQGEAELLQARIAQLAKGPYNR